MDEKDKSNNKLLLRNIDTNKRDGIRMVQYF